MACRISFQLPVSANQARRAKLASSGQSQPTKQGVPNWLQVASLSQLSMVCQTGFQLTGLNQLSMACQTGFQLPVSTNEAWRAELASSRQFQPTKQGVPNWLQVASLSQARHAELASSCQSQPTWRDELASSCQSQPTKHGMPNWLPVASLNQLSKACRTGFKLRVSTN